MSRGSASIEQDRGHANDTMTSLERLCRMQQEKDQKIHQLQALNEHLIQTNVNLEQENKQLVKYSFGCSIQ